MPMYEFALIDQGKIIGVQEQEVQDDEAALNETFDHMDLIDQGPDGPYPWVQVRKIYPDGRRLPLSIVLEVEET